MSNFHGQQLADYCALEHDPVRRFSRYVRILGWLIRVEQRRPGSVEYLCRNTGWHEIERLVEDEEQRHPLSTRDVTQP